MPWARLVEAIMTAPGATLPKTPARYHDAIVYADESGDHASHSDDYPVLVLAFCLFEKTAYAELVTTAIQKLKFKYFGHDAVVLHERDIRRATNEFSILHEKPVREAFFADLNDLIDNAQFTIVAAAILKKELKRMSWRECNAYHLAVQFCVERVIQHFHLCANSRQLHVVFERRGKEQDAELEAAFRKCAAENITGRVGPLVAKFGNKLGSFAGLELADLVARPIGRHVLNPYESNRAWDILQPKLRRGPQGQVDGWGLKCFP